MFRALKWEIYRSLFVAKTAGNSSISCLYSAVRTHATYSELSKDKKFITGFEDLLELQRLLWSPERSSVEVTGISAASGQSSSVSHKGNADENVQRIFSLANAPQKEKRKAVHSELMKKCNNAQERKIAEMTVSVANLEDHLQRMRNKDKHNKVYLQWLKDQRTKKLKSLKMSNFERYVQLVKYLDIEPLSSTHSKYAKYKFRRFKIGVEIKEKKSLAVRKNPVQSQKKRAE